MPETQTQTRNGRATAEAELTPVEMGSGKHKGVNTALPDEVMTRLAEMAEAHRKGYPVVALARDILAQAAGFKIVDNPTRVRVTGLTKEQRRIRDAKLSQRRRARVQAILDKVMSDTEILKRLGISEELLSDEITPEEIAAAEAEEQAKAQATAQAAAPTEQTENVGAPA